MLETTLRAKITEYAPANELEQENVLQELLQHYVLASLSRGGLFSVAAFHGGTCLRIVHGMNRFSEDLDFLLKAGDPSFRWAPYLARVQKDCAMEGIDLEVQDRSAADVAVQKAFLKAGSLGQVLQLAVPFARDRRRKFRIKLEIDTNPPAGSTYRTSYITFPSAAALTTQALESGFALKIHALLCRSYCKGRDWYDFVWYVTRKVEPTLPLLANALHQQGPWAAARPEVTPSGLVSLLRGVIGQVDWAAARDDVRRFLPQGEQAGLSTWSADFFLSLLDRMAEYLAL